ncbi:hypothetical protein ABIA32_003866 [Streptacidiphilus sp. MAP12-20]|uniref:hypothetical protein n=1 Tax=Streptacidiphilus sp. MAP12-20 TaxID=3156299 RepID=UPI003517FECB
MATPQMPQLPQRGYAFVPPPVPMGEPPPLVVFRARKARTFRRVLAVPFWALLALSITSWPITAIKPDSAWTFGQILGTLLLAPTALLRAIPTGLFLNATPGTRRGIGCGTGFGLFLGTFLLTFAANVFGPVLTPTVAVTATVAECHRDTGQGHHPLKCSGSWTADGTTVRDRQLPVEGTPGSTVSIQVRADDPYTAFAPLTGGREAFGAGLGLAGSVVTGASLLALATHTRQVNRRLRQTIASGTPVPTAR